MDNFFDFIKEYPSVKRMQVKDLLFAEYQCPLSETRYDIWSHHNYFIYVTSGKKKWFTLDQNVLVQRGDCLFVRKGAHSVYQYFDSEFCAVVLFLPDSFIRSVLLDHQIQMPRIVNEDSNTTLYSITADRQLAGYFHSFLSYLTGTTVPDEALIELKFKELVILSASGSRNRELAGYFTEICKTDKPPIRDVMEANYTYPMSLKEYARLSGRSLSAFKRDFKKTYNTTPGRWLVRKRLQLATYLLEHTDKSITEIVFDAGFRNASHFSRVFKEQTGHTPLEHSRLHRKEKI